MQYSNIIYNGKNSYSSFGVIITDKDIGTVERKRITVDIPYTNKPLSFDYSDLAGESIYSQRHISYTFTIVGADDEDLFTRHTALRNWLLKSDTGDLFDSDLKYYHYTARCISVSKLTRVSKRVGKITAEFTANPYLESVNFAAIAWDTFVFATDSLYEQTYKANANNTYKAYTIKSAADHDIAPRITHTPAENSMTPLTILKDGITYCVPYNCKQMTISGLVFEPGNNNIQVGGYGSVTIDLCEEVL